MVHRLNLEPEEREPAPQPRPWRAATIALVMVALAGALWGGYHAFGHRASGDAIPVIHADDRPVKVAPTNPGGMAVPDQDMYVLNKPRSLDSRVEQILPPPESPLPRPTPPEPEASAALPAITEDAAPANVPAVTPPNAAAPVTPPPVVAMPGTPPPAIPAPPLAPSRPLASVTVPIPPAPQAVPPPQDAPAALHAPSTPPASVAQPPSPQVAIAPAVPPLLPAPPPRPAPAHESASLPPPSSAGVAYRIQLGALHSVEAAQQEWTRLKKMQPELLGKLHADAVRYDLGERGVIYRIEAGPIDGAVEADRLCNSLRQRSLGCLLVKP